MAYTEVSIKKFLSKNNISPEQIRYILRSDNETCFHMLDNRVISTLIPLNHFQNFFSENDFTRINKSYLVRNEQVINVKKGVYLMTDGARLEGRHHSIKRHTDFMRELVMEQKQQDDSSKVSLLKKKLSGFDDLPLPFCMIQPAFDVYGKSTSFVFRYCNRMLALMEKQTPGSIINHTFREVFQTPPQEEWLVMLADISKNGGIKVFRFFSRQYDSLVYALCYQLTPGFCGCVLIPDGWVDVLEELNKSKVLFEQKSGE